MQDLFIVKLLPGLSHWTSTLYEGLETTLELILYYIILINLINQTRQNVLFFSGGS